jgi:trimethylamine--corrinoid protein Co-methyltransferase
VFCLYNIYFQGRITMIKPAQWKTRFNFLTEADLKALHAASLQIMERTGLVMPLSPARQAQARDLGLKVNDHRLYFPPHVVEQAVKQAPRHYTLYARNPQNDLPLDGRHGYLSLDGSGTDVLDLTTGQVRPSTKADLQATLRLADALPQIAFLWPTVSAQDYPEQVQPLHELEAMLTHSAKHAQAMTAVTPLAARGSVAMAAEVAGGRESLRQRPIISNFQCSVSPLSYDAPGLEAAFIFAEAGIPTGFLNMTIGCGTAPATLAGNAAMANAEVLAGITLLQLFYPGAPTFYGTSATVMELRRGGVTCGGPEDFLLQAAGCQLAHFYNVPASIGTFATGAKCSGWQAGLENGLSGVINHFTNADLMSGAGLLNAAKIFSFEQLVLDCEIFDMLRAVSRGFEINADTLALDVINAVGPQNHFMTTDHTFEHMVGLWQPTVLDRTPWEEWEQRGRPSAADHARARARDLLAGHEPEPLPCAGVLREIIAEYERP